MDGIRAAVEAIPVLPVVKAYICVTAPTPEVVKASVQAAMGALIVEDPAAAHVHTPHCEHAAPVPVSSPQPPTPVPPPIHLHTVACNHAAAPAGALLEAAKAGDAAGVAARLAAGDSTEQADKVG